MAAPMEARNAIRRFYRLLTCSQQSYLLHARQMGFVDKLKTLQWWSEKETEESVIEDGADETNIVPAIPVRKRECIEEVRSYQPPADAVERISYIVEEVYGSQADMNLQLNNRAQKFDLLTRVMEDLDHDIASVDLNDMNTVQDVFKYFKVEVKDTSALEDLTKLDLPKNLHINTEYIRFHPDTDNIYDGITAFPGRPTRVSSIKYKRKYKGFDGGDVINDPDKIIGL